MKHTKRGFTLIELIIFICGGLLIMHLAFGVVNIYFLTQCDFEKPYKAEVLRIGAFFVPTGTIIMSFISNESLDEPKQEVDIKKGIVAQGIKGG